VALSHEPAMSPVVIPAVVRDRVIDWLEEAAQDAADELLYPEPHLATAFQDLADELRRAGSTAIDLTTTSSQESA